MAKLTFPATLLKKIKTDGGISVAAKSTFLTPALQKTQMVGGAS